MSKAAAPTSPRCLMLKDRNGRHFFTHESNIMPLLEFVRTFGMDMALVNAPGARLLDLSDLPKAVCDTKVGPRVAIEVVEQIVPYDESKLVHIPLARTRTELMQTYKEVRQQIAAWFKSGLTLDMKFLKENLANHELSDTSLRSQFNKVKQDLIDQGFTINSPKKGAYAATFPDPAILPNPVTLTAIKPGGTVNTPEVLAGDMMWTTPIMWNNTTWGTTGTIVFN